ncbi:MAG: HAMP domain-containing sensor histidine kinase [Verrucomicrobia bacterium]|nr:HAMP domain-containing sensor histidine kinase [Verrucomicrobiota bacterium]
MKKVALVFVLAVFVPSLVLAWLAVRSLRDQQFLLERQQSLLYQGVADALAVKVQDALADQQHTFALKVTTLLRDGDARAVARSFDSRLCRDWPLAKVGFAVTTAGEILAPSPQGRTEARTFYTDNGRFLANRETVEVYLNPKTAFNTGQVPSPTPPPTSFPSADLNLGTNRALQTTVKPGIANTPSQQSTPLSLDRNTESGLPQPQSQQNLALANNTQDKDLPSAQNQAMLTENNTYLNRKSGYNQKQELRNVVPQRQAELFQNNAFPRYKQQPAPKPAPPPATNAPVQPPIQARSEASVREDQQAQIIQPPAAAPQQAAAPVQSLAAAEDNQQQFSQSTPSEAEFRQLIGDDHEGTLARFVDNKLSVLFWYRPPLNPDFVFGAQIALPHLARELQTVVQEIEATLREEICIALLDDTAKPVALSHPGFHATWKRPFVATEIGEALPHWEVAVYLLNPAKLTQSAHTLTLTLGLLIGVLLLAIGVGSWLIVADLNRQLTLARQKTDFVSNVSHELKTPLTSIRMFSELLAEGRVTDRAKQRSYLGIITAETARLTRLINNVLDFARIERGEKKYNFQKCDLVSVVRETADSYRPHLEANGFQFACELPDSPVFINGDRDALAQVIVNLLSNAEKYSDTWKEVTLSMNLAGPRHNASVNFEGEHSTRQAASPPHPAVPSSPESGVPFPLAPSEEERAGVRGPSAESSPASQDLVDFL